MKMTARTYFLLAGIALMLVSASSLLTLFWSNFSDYMFFEDLGFFDEGRNQALGRISNGERGMLLMSGAGLVTGLTVSIFAAISSRKYQSDEPNPT